MPTPLVGFNSTLMIRYVEFVADRLLLALDVPAIYHSTNPFDFMELISLFGIYSSGVVSS